MVALTSRAAPAWASGPPMTTTTATTAAAPRTPAGAEATTTTTTAPGTEVLGETLSRPDTLARTGAGIGGLALLGGLLCGGGRLTVLTRKLPRTGRPGEAPSPPVGSRGGMTADPPTSPPVVPRRLTPPAALAGVAALRGAYIAGIRRNLLE